MVDANLTLPKLLDDNQITPYVRRVALPGFA